MNSLAVATLFVAIACANASGWGLAGGIDSAAILTGPSGVVARNGLGVGLVGGGLVGGGLVGGGVIAGGIAPGIVAPGLIGRGIIGGHGILASPEARALAGGANLALAPAGLNTVLTPAGSGLEGQYVPDINEHLYEDGQYKPEIYGL